MRYGKHLTREQKRAAQRRRANLPEWCGQQITTMAEFEKAVAV